MIWSRLLLTWGKAGVSIVSNHQWHHQCCHLSTKSGLIHGLPPQLLLSDTCPVFDVFEWFFDQQAWALVIPGHRITCVSMFVWRTSHHTHLLIIGLFAVAACCHIFMLHSTDYECALPTPGPRCRPFVRCGPMGISGWVNRQRWYRFADKANVHQPKYTTCSLCHSQIWHIYTTDTTTSRNGWALVGQVTSLPLCSCFHILMQN